jgi:DNA mismatch repair protein MutS
MNNYMSNIKDLHVEKEILPLFDFVCNEYARDVLTDLLTDIPATLEEVLCRQQIIRTLLSQEVLYLPFHYYQSEFNEVYNYLDGLKSRGNRLSGASLKIHLLFARSERNKDRGYLHQVIAFFYKVYQAWYVHLDEGQFPATFGGSIKNCKQFLTDFGIVKFRGIVDKRSLDVVEVAGLREFLEEKTRNGEMDVFLKEFFLFEAYLSISKGVRKHHFIFPVFGGKAFSLNGFYHPLLKAPVRNSFEMKGNVTLITGPNMSGKSTLLKSIGICVLLAHLGLAVPAEQCEIPYFDVVAVSIDLNDDLRNGYSHFMTEIKSLKTVVTAAKDQKNCFAIFDELFRGTNAEDAVEISKKTIAGLTRFPGSVFLISTHLHPLKEMVMEHASGIGAHFIECILDNDRPVFTYKLRDGWSDLKIGQILFEQEGLNQLLKGGNEYI